MKIYSEILDKFFDTAEECENAETLYQKEKEEKEQKQKEKSLAISKEKKELATAVETAEAALAKAYDNYEEVKEQVRKILEESNQRALDILQPAKEEIKKAQEEKYKAISAFNKKFGVYTTTYSGDKAYRELKRATSWINDIFDKFLF